MADIIISKGAILCAFAYWGVSQSPYDYPVNLIAALNAISERLDDMKLFKSKHKHTPGSYSDISPDKLKALIDDLVFKTPEIAIWNLTQNEMNDGIHDPNDPGRAVTFGVGDRTGTWQSKNNDFVDLYALSSNIYEMIAKE